MRWARLNTLDMGLPQNRPRLYIWGVRSDITEQLPDVSGGSLGEPLRLRDILGDDAPKKPEEWTEVEQLLPAAAAEVSGLLLGDTTR